jgi:hypothetical protein
MVILKISSNDTLANSVGSGFDFHYLSASVETRISRKGENSEEISFLCFVCDRWPT